MLRPVKTAAVAVAALLLAGAAQAAPGHHRRGHADHWRSRAEAATMREQSEWAPYAPTGQIQEPIYFDIAAR
jgi:hypothetical protein